MPDANAMWAQAGKGIDRTVLESLKEQITTIPIVPSALSVNPDGIPVELRDLRQWVGWSWEYRPGKNGEEGKWTKPPLSPVSGHKASSTDPATWASFADALRFVRSHRLPGIGRVVTRDDPDVGIDLDDCRNPETGEVAAWAQALIDRFASYTELSPTGTGIRIVIRTRTGLLPGDERGRREGPVEVYGDGRYFTLTGHRLNETSEIAERTDELATFCAEVFGPPPTRETPPPRHGTPVLSDAELIERARAAANGAKFMRLWAGDTSEYDGDDSAADLALLGVLAFYTQDIDQLDRLFRRSALYRPKWERSDYRERTIGKALATRTVYRPRTRVGHAMRLGLGKARIGSMHIG